MKIATLGLTKASKHLLAVAVVAATALPCVAQISENTPDDQWALVRLSAANFREDIGQPSELGTQGLMGHPVKILEKKGSWSRVETSDGYKAWAENDNITPKTQDEMQAWRQAPRVVVSSLPQTYVYTDTINAGPWHILSDVVNGNILEGTLSTGGAYWTQVTLPDGRQGWVRNADMLDFAEWSTQPFDAQKILEIAYSCLNTPYLWGGTSTKAMDCSGLSKLSYLRNGRILQRNASQQARDGMRIDGDDIYAEGQPGDLLFFGNADTGKITHVAIYEGDGQYIHASGRVKINNILPNNPLFTGRAPLWAVRMAGNEGTHGIWLAAQHPWYTNNK